MLPSKNFSQLYEQRSNTFAIRYEAQNVISKIFTLFFNTIALTTAMHISYIWQKALCCQSSRILPTCCPDTTQHSMACL